MYKRVNESVLYCLKGKMFKCSLKLTVSRMLKLLTLLYVMSVTYLLVYDTSFIVSIGLYNNEITAIGVCVVAVLIGVILFAGAQWTDFSAKHYLWSQMQNLPKRKPDVNIILKLFMVRTAVRLLKIFITVSALFPAILCSTVFYIGLERGISKMSATCLLVGSVMLLLSGVVFSIFICKRYYLAEYCIYDGTNVREVLRLSVYLMDSKCCKLAKYQLKNIFYKISGLFIPAFRVISDAREFFFVTDKTIEYARKAHTHQKTVVFYCNKTTA